MKKKVFIAGSGISGLATAAYLARQGFTVEIFEKNEAPGGRLRQFQAEGFTFNMGPSWYWFPEVIQEFFEYFGKEVSDLFTLERLDPLFRLDFGTQLPLSIPADRKQLVSFFESVETGSGAKLDRYLNKAAQKYHQLHQEVDYYSTSNSLLHFLYQKLFNAHARYVHSLFRDPRLVTLLEFPLPYMGLVPIRHPMVAYALNYSLYEQGLYYPKGGMHQLIEALVQLLDKLDVPIHVSSPVESFDVIDDKVSGIITHGKSLHADYFIAATDYRHAEHLLPKEFRNYPEERWGAPSKAPVALIFYLGLNKKLPQLLPHTVHLEFPAHTSPSKKTSSATASFISCPSKLDASLAPQGMESLIIRINIPQGMEDTGRMREHYFEKALRMLETVCDEKITSHVVYKKTYASSDFEHDYNTHMGSPFGWSGTLAMLNERNVKMQNQQLPNLFYAEYPSFLGTGVPSALLSAKTIANKVAQEHYKYYS